MLTSAIATDPTGVAKMIDNASHFLYHIANEVEKRRMPLEIALLPMIESAYNPVAYSSAHASGIWQFIPSTGRRYQLKSDAVRDERSVCEVRAWHYVRADEVAVRDSV